MNTEKLIEIVSALQADIDRTEIRPSFQSFINALQGYVSQVNQNTQNNLSSQTQTLYRSIETSKIDEFSPGWKQFLIEIGANEYFGSPLKSKIAEILGRNQITSSLALEEIRPIFLKFTELADGISQLNSGFHNLHLEAYELAQNECEFGIVMPRASVDNNLRDFEKECKDLNFIVGSFNELITGSRPDIKIKEISSSDFILYLALVPAVGGAIAKSIDWILAKYKELLEIKKMKIELAKAGVPEKNLKGLDDHANSLIEAEVKKVVAKLLAEGSVKEKGRKHELDTNLTKSLNMIANRIDRGFNFEIRVQISPETADEADIEIANTIRETAENLKFIKNGEGRILQLPEKTTSEPKAKDADAE